MKRNFILLAIAFFALMTSCKEADYQKEVETRLEAFDTFYKDLKDNAEMSMDEKEDAFEAEYEILIKDIETLGNKALAKHSDDSIAVYFVTLYANLDITDDEGMLTLINNLGPNAQADPSVQKMKAHFDSKKQTAEGTKFIDFEVPQPDGSVKKLSDYAGKGKYCLVDFWASWCGPCKGEIPNLKNIYEKYGKKGLEMVSVAVWDKPDASRDTAAAYGITWNHILDAGSEPTNIYAIRGIPHILLIGPDGTILKRDLRGEKIAEELEKYF